MYNWQENILRKAEDLCQVKFLLKIIGAEIKKLLETDYSSSSLIIEKKIIDLQFIFQLEPKVENWDMNLFHLCDCSACPQKILAHCVISIQEFLHTEEYYAPEGKIKEYYLELQYDNYIWKILSLKQIS